jgi:hypothetical protein
MRDRNQKPLIPRKPKSGPLIEQEAIIETEYLW